MDIATMNKINDKLKYIPNNLAKDIIAYIDFLSFKQDDSDWSEAMSTEEIHLIEKGKNDINSNNTYSDVEAKNIILQHKQKLQ